MAKTQELTDQSIVNYKRWLMKADEWICDSERDYYTLLKRAWELSDFSEVDKLCDEYENLLIADKEWAKKEDIGESPKELGNWISAFRKYKEFIKKCENDADANQKAKDAMIKASRLSAEHLFLDTRFHLWCIAKGLSENTVDSYKSNIRCVNREIFCKCGHDLFQDFLPNYVKKRDEAKIDTLFTNMDNILTTQITNYNTEAGLSRKELQNCLSALRKYAEFIKSIVSWDGESASSTFPKKR